MNLSLVSSDSSADLPKFLNYLFEGLEGYVSCATKTTDSEGNVVFTRESFIWPSSEADLRGWIIENASRSEVYLSPAIFDAPSGKREHFKASNVFWMDCDKGVPTDEQLGDIPRPTLRVRSSEESREHWYWKAESPVSDVETLQQINRSLAYQLGGDISGWDANQVLRPPNTYNHKRQKPVSLLDCTDDRVALVNFNVLPAYEPIVVDVPTEVIPDVTDVVLKYAWPADAAELYRSKPAAPTVENEGERSTAMMRLAYYLAEMGMSDAEMFSILRNADDRWGKFKDRTDRERRLVDIIGVARRKYPADVILPDDAVPIYGLLSFLNTEVEIEWVVPGLLQAAGYMLLTGPAGVGKTQFSLRWAINLALGRDFLGHEVVSPKRILFWSLEMGHPDLKFFLDTMCSQMSQEELLMLEQNLLIAPLGESFYLDIESTQKQFEAIISDFAVDGVFIDSMGSSASGAITDESTVRAVMDFNDSLRQRYGVFTWFIHHMRKAQGDNKKPNKQADVYGNQYLVNRATSVYCLWPAGHNIDVIPLKKRLSAMEEPWQITRYNNLDFMRKNTTVTFKESAPNGTLLEGDEEVLVTQTIVDL